MTEDECKEIMESYSVIEEGKEMYNQAIQGALSKALRSLRVLPQVSNVLIIANVEGEGLVAYTNTPDSAFLQDISEYLSFARGEHFQKVDKTVSFNQN